MYLHLRGLSSDVVRLADMLSMTYNVGYPRRMYYSSKIPYARVFNFARLLQKSQQ